MTTTKLLKNNIFGFLNKQLNILDRNIFNRKDTPKNIKCNDTSIQNILNAKQIIGIILLISR